MEKGFKGEISNQLETSEKLLFELFINYLLKIHVFSYDVMFVYDSESIWSLCKTTKISSYLN